MMWQSFVVVGSPFVLLVIYTLYYVYARLDTETRVRVLQHMIRYRD